MLRLGLLWCVLALPLLVLAQAEEGQVCRWLKTTTTPAPLDSLTVVASSIQLADTSLQWQYSTTTGTIRFDPAAELPDSVYVCYSTLPYALHQPVQKRSLALYDSLAPFKIPAKPREEVWEQEELFSSEDIQKSGSISRGISFGNTQDVFVQSALNLQLEGRLTEKIGLRASISDQNIPFQPDGNTQNLQEFDKVFVELFTDSSQLIAGDLQLRNAPGSFLRYQRNVQGLSFRTSTPWLSRGSSETQVAAAAARGQFSAVELQPVEGMLGPYRLGGAAGQGYVMVLANSERVYLDGRLLERGFQYDYIIDYNLGEISFTPGTIITRYSRIRVEYEYADQQYRRGIITASHQQQIGRASFFSSFYQEKDNRHQPLFFNLSDEDMTRLSEAGDGFSNLWSAAWDSVGYAPEQLRYRLADTLDADGQQRQVFVYSNDETQAHYHLAFTQVGQGVGNYVLEEITPRGRVYAWVTPVNGVPQGQFEPVRKLEAPRKRQLISGGGSYQLGKWSKIWAEVALSEWDQNLFSDLGEADDKGLAVKSGLSLDGLPVTFGPGWHWKVGLEYELANRNFTPIDRYRSIEYDRYWGLLAREGYGVQPTPWGSDDHLLSAWAGLEKDGENKLHYRFSNRHLPGLVQGWQQEVTAAKTWGIWAGAANFFLMQNQQTELAVHWQRLQLDQHLRLKRLVPGYAYWQEQNTFRQPQTDSVLSSDQYFREHRFYIKNPEAARSRYLLEYSLREDKAPVWGEMEKANAARQLRAQWFTDPEKNQQLGFQMSYRQSQAYLDSLQDDNEEQILTGQLQWNSLLWEGAFRQQLTYSAGSGREIRRDFMYVKVPAGEGTHVWRDNNDDEVQQQEEFFEAVLPDEKLYIRVLVPGTALTQAYSSELQYRLNLSSPVSWRERGGWRKVLNPFSAIFNIRLNQKLTEGDHLQRFLPALTELDEAKLLHQRQQWQATVFYNRSNPAWGLEGGFHKNSRKQLLSAGFETGEENNYYLVGRKSFTRTWNLRLQANRGSQKDLSDFLGEQRYLVQAWSLEPQLTWRPLQQLEFDVMGRYKHKENLFAQEQLDRSRLKEIGLGFLVSRQLTTSLRGQLRLTEIDFTGSTNTPVSYALLEALKPGSNWTWNLQLQQRVMKGLMLNVVYDGRQSEDALVVHTGRMMLRALF